MKVLPLTVGILSIVFAVGCGSANKQAAPTPTAEVQQYATEMESWWGDASKANVPLTSLVVPDGLDAVRIQEADELRPGALPKVDAPSNIAPQHDLLVSALFGWAYAEGQVEVAGLYAGLAAAFCNPRTSGIAWISDWRAVEALQVWRDSDESCSDGDRWAGNWSPGMDDRSKSDYTYYQWGCSNDLEDFGVYSSDLDAACRNRDVWRRSLSAAATLWTNELTTLCVGHPPTVPGSISDALASCH